MRAMRWCVLAVIAGACGGRSGLPVVPRDASSVPDAPLPCPASNEPERLLLTPDVLPDGIVAVGGWLYFGGAYRPIYEGGVEQQRRGAIFRVAPSGGAPEKIADDYCFGKIATDGDYLYYATCVWVWQSGDARWGGASFRATFPAITARPIAGGPARQLPTPALFQQPARVPPAVHTNGKPGVYWLALTSGSPPPWATVRASVVHWDPESGVSNDIVSVDDRSNFDVDDESAYVEIGGDLHAVPIAGGPSRRVATRVDYQGPLALDASSVFFTRNERIVRLGKTDGHETPSNLAFDSPYSDTAGILSVHGPWMYYSFGNLERSRFDGCCPIDDPHCLCTWGSGVPRDIALADCTVYWTVQEPGWAVMARRE